MIKAVIFDMDGVLIESEHLWRKAMIEGFAEAGMQLSENDCRKTMGMRFPEVITLWLSHFGLTEIDPKILENRVIDLLLGLIWREGRFIGGIPEIIAFCRQQRLKLGLATSSSQRLMNAVLDKLDLTDKIDVALSAEHMAYGKPHPEVFLACARQLGVEPSECLVIEDSLNGVIAGKAALMKVIAVPDDEHTKLQQFAIADYKFDNMTEVLVLFKTLFSQ
jgi:beta-phosphoglucomutase-like phosphatase (HAD superfamily)